MELRSQGPAVAWDEMGCSFLVPCYDTRGLGLGSREGDGLVKGCAMRRPEQGNPRPFRPMLLAQETARRWGGVGVELKPLVHYTDDHQVRRIEVAMLDTTTTTTA